jgi:hypothetical protein
MGEVIDRYRQSDWLSQLRLNKEVPAFYALIFWFHAAVLAPAMLLPGKASAATRPVSEFVVPSGPVITLQDGQRINGHIIEFDQTNVIIRTVDGAEQTLPRATIDTVRFETVTGMEITGALIGWQPGVYELTTDEAVVTVYSTIPASIEEPVTAASQEPKTAAPDSEADTEDEIIETAAKPEPDPGAPVEAGSKTGVISEAAAATADDESGDVVNQSAEPSKPADGVVEEQLAAVNPVSDLEISVVADHARENGQPVGFNIELSRPSENSVVLIYATIDGTAVDGEDYVAARGVLVIKAGETTARIEAPTIDDDISEDQENLQLFLTADPAVATVRNRKIVATIDDDDDAGSSLSQGPEPGPVLAD